MISINQTAFIKSFILSFALLAFLATLFVYLVDPYDSLPLSPTVERAPVVHNQRFSYAALARSPKFDSVIVGTSMLRMLKPIRLNSKLNANFANLSMNSATAWEQEQMLRLFLRHHPRLKFAIIDIGAVWCNPTKLEPQFAKNWADGQGVRPIIFPTWLYDHNPYNDYLNLLDFKALENSGYQLAYMLGLHSPRYGLDGWASMNTIGAPYDLQKARRKIYGQTKPNSPKPELIVPEVSKEQQLQWSFPELSVLKQLLTDLPSEATKLVVFVPFHHQLAGAPGSWKYLKYARCKELVAEIASDIENMQVLDMMFRNRFTLNDANYWDAWHYHDRAANEVEDVIGQYLKYGVTTSSIARSLPHDKDIITSAFSP